MTKIAESYAESQYNFWQGVYEIMMKIMVKICELFGSLVCKALEVTGDLGAALVAGNSNEFAFFGQASLSAFFNLFAILSCNCIDW